MQAEPTAAALADLIRDRSARGIAADVAGLIRRGELTPGTRLPTVRALAAELGVSPATVSEAWVQLRARRAVRGQGRGGTFVVGAPSTPRPARTERTGNFGARLAVDLTLAGPDPRLLPELGAALAGATRVVDLNDYRREGITRELRETVAAGWPFPADDFMATNGGYDGMLLLLETTLVAGDRVAIEDPTAPRLLDILEAVGATVVPVRCDERGPDPASLSTAMALKPAVFVYQPRAQTPTGSVVDESRLQELAAILQGSDTLVIEDDGSGDAASAPLVSIGSLLPRQVVLVKSYSKSYGPDLRVAVLGGAGEAIERARLRRSFGAGWTSRLLQMALAQLLRDDTAADAVAGARATYARRRERMTQALVAHGLDVHNRDGLAVWIPVRDQQDALVTLAAHGVAASPGDRFHHGRATPHIRAAVSMLDDDRIDEVAGLLALAAGTVRRA